MFVVNRRRLRQLVLVVVYTLGLLGIVASGGGGSGSGSGNDGWVTITEPSSSDYYEIVITDPSETRMQISGDAFVSIDSHDGGCVIIPPFFWTVVCTDPSSESDVKISIINELTCKGEGWTSVDGKWGGEIRATLGENQITVVAEDSKGNQGTDSINIKILSPPFTLPMHSISDRELPSSISCDPDSWIGRSSISTNSHGDTIAAWMQYSHVYAAIYTDTSGWSPILMLSDKIEYISPEPRVAIDIFGNAIVVWHGETSLNSNCDREVWEAQCAVSRKYESGVGWLPPEIIPGADVTNHWDSRLVMDEQGNGLFYWYEYNGVWKEFVASYTPVNGWGQVSETIVASKNDLKISSHFISDGNGGARAVWDGYVGDSPKIFYSEFNEVNGWTTPEVLGDGREIIFGEQETKPRIALSSSGNMVVAWTKKLRGDAQNQLVANYFSSGSGWSGQTSIETDDTGSADHAAVGIDASGNALIIWSQFDGTRQVIRANNYIPGLGWGVEYDIGFNNPGDAVNPKLVMDDSGNATAIWRKYDEWSNSVVGNKYSATMVWSGPELIETSKAEGTENLQIGLGQNSEAIVAWEQYHDILPDPINHSKVRTKLRVGVY